MANKTVTANINKSANNTRRINANIVATTNANVTTTTNKATSNTRKAYANVMAISKDNNARKVHIKKAATINKGNTKSIYQHSNYRRRHHNGQKKSRSQHSNNH